MYSKEQQFEHRISAKVVEFSESTTNTLVTFELTFPRIILAELNTHRVFSRSTSSSRAVPVDKVNAALEEPFVPVRFGANQAGMSPADNLNAADTAKAHALWLLAANSASATTVLLKNLGVHKQWANRITEPFSYVSTVVTTSEVENFFALRDHEAAQDEMQILACAMKEACNKATPKGLEKGEWHLPFVTDEERASRPLHLCILASAMRCGGVSYFRQGLGREFMDAALKAQDMAKSVPCHASPFEHQATPDPMWLQQHLHGNFRGWIQFRRMLDYFNGEQTKELQNLVNTSLTC